MNEVLIPVTRRQAAQYANRYLASFANKPAHPVAFLQNLTEVFATLPEPVCEGVLNPHYGAITKSDRPCLADLKKFVDEWMGKPANRFDSSSIEDDGWEPPSDEERARVLALLTKTRRALTAATVRHRAPKPGAEVSEPPKPVSMLSAAQNEAIEAYLADE